MSTAATASVTIDPPVTASATTAPPTTQAATTSAKTTTTVPLARFSDRRGVGQPYGAVEGITMFRGNLSRSWYGTGPVPQSPEILWKYPDARMCGASTHHGEPKTWCGTGWTAQPVIWERADGITELIVGSYVK